MNDLSALTKKQINYIKVGGVIIAFIVLAFSLKLVPHPNIPVYARIGSVSLSKIQAAPTQLSSGREYIMFSGVSASSVRLVIRYPSSAEANMPMLKAGSDWISQVSWYPQQLGSYTFTFIVDETTSYVFYGSYGIV